MSGFQHKPRKLHLSALVNHHNHAVVRRFATDHGVGLRESAVIFADLMRFFYLSHRAIERTRRTGAQRPSIVRMLSIWSVIDAMWHTYLLFTEDYARFCKKYFGQLIHHRPERQSRSYLDIADRSHRLFIERHMDLVLEHLGMRVFKRWFLVYPRRSLPGRAM